MGCDIHLIGQRKLSGTTDSPEWEDVDEFFKFDRSYGMFGFWVGVRNYSGLTPLSEPRGLPDDFHPVDNDDIHAPVHDFRDDGYHSRSWFSLQELLDVDYDQMIEDRRYTEHMGGNHYDGGATCEPGNGQVMSLREFLGSFYFEELDRMKAAGVERVVFCFDN
jgi:hypothetical protein